MHANLIDVIPRWPDVEDPVRLRALSMALRLGDRLTDATNEYEVIGRPYAHVRVKHVDNAEVTMMRTYGAHEHISMKRACAEWLGDPTHAD